LAEPAAARGAFIACAPEPSRYPLLISEKLNILHILLSSLPTITAINCD
jgi:hypothetical protein